MKVALNPINTNTKSNNPNQVNFKARAELRLSEAFLDELMKLKPEEAASRIQGLIDVVTFLKKVAPKIGKRDELVTLANRGDKTEEVYLSYYKRYGGEFWKKSGKLYDEKVVNIVFLDGEGDAKHYVRNFVNGNKLLKDGGKLPTLKKRFRYGGFSASQDGTLTRVRYNLPYTKELGREKTTLAELMAKLKALCTPIEHQRQLKFR